MLTAAEGRCSVLAVNQPGPGVETSRNQGEHTPGHHRGAKGLMSRFDGHRADQQAINLALRQYMDRLCLRLKGDRGLSSTSTVLS